MGKLLVKFRHDCCDYDLTGFKIYRNRIAFDNDVKSFFYMNFQHYSKDEVSKFEEEAREDYEDWKDEYSTFEDFFIKEFLPNEGMFMLGDKIYDKDFSYGDDCEWFGLEDFLSDFTLEDISNEDADTIEKCFGKRFGSLPL